MKAKNYFMISVLAFLACACQDDEVAKPTPTPGEAVQFGSVLGQNSTTRTIYGPEDEAGHVFPILWLKGDQVVVASPQCGVKQSTYQVPDEADMQNYADPLNGLGEANVQWGNTETADFYSIYPASGVKSVGSDYKSFTLTMPEIQENPVEVIDGKKVVKPIMDGCFMSARTMNVPNGATVELQYEPLSTAIRFTVQGGDNSTDQNRKTIIEKIVLRAPEGVAVAGDFTVSFAEDGTRQYTPVGTGSNEIEIIPYYKESSGYISLGLNEGVELNAFIIPQNEDMAFDGWELEVSLTDGKSYKTTLQGAAGTGQNLNLKAGMIHRLGTLNNLPINNVWDNTHWMQYIPRNVYLSEISIPGAWNSINEDSQAGKGIGQINTLYDNGIRAFHFDTRWQRSGFINYNYTLKIADGTTSIGGYITSGAVNFTSALDALAAKASENPEEYCVLLVTYAQGSGEGYNWITTLNEACANSSQKEHIVMGSEITQNTVVGEVLGKLIVLVGTEDEVTTYQEIPNDGKYLYSNVPAMLIQKTFQENPYNEDNLFYSRTATNGIHLYNTQAQVSAYERTGTDGIATTNLGYAPTIDERKTKAGNIYKWSKENYEKAEFAHNNWIFVGLGGYMVRNTNGDRPSGVDTQISVAETMNTWLNDNILSKMADRPNTNAGETGFYPVGMVYMNKVHNYQELINRIIQLNTQYRKAYDPNKSSETGLPLNPGRSDVTSAAPGYSGGMTDNNEYAVNVK